MNIKIAVSLILLCSACSSYKGTNYGNPTEANAPVRPIKSVDTGKPLSKEEEANALKMKKKLPETNGKAESNSETQYEAAPSVPDTL